MRQNVSKKSKEVGEQRGETGTKLVSRPKPSALEGRGFLPMLRNACRREEGLALPARKPPSPLPFR
jgi:hypothetical protein